MKKLGKLLTIILALALFLLTPSLPVAVNGIVNLVTADTDGLTAPNQNSNAFTSEAVGSYDFANWTKSINSSLVSQQVTPDNNKQFHDKYPYTTLSDANLDHRSPYVIATKTPNVATNGYYTTDAITLSANGYYMIKVEYCLQEQTGINNETQNYAFGTFYLTDHLNQVHTVKLDNTGWRFKTFYIHTDVLETVTVTPKLYFGSKDQNALGAIYFNKFTVTAVNEYTFRTTTHDESDNLKVDAGCYLDYSKLNQEYISVAGDFSNSKFTGTNSGDAESTNKIVAAKIPARLGFHSEQPYFYSKDGDNSEVMLMKSQNNSTTRLTLNDYTFQPKPHEVYMFQFYSIATASTEFNQFYFNIEPTADGKGTALNQTIENLDSYPYHNGWQLNTLFYVAGHDLDQAFTISFSLQNTGWVCLDALKIYKVNGSYAENNSTALGVHKLKDMNVNGDNESTSQINGYFELGTAANNVQQINSGYPYPLVAQNWTTDNSNNGIVNLAFMHASFGDINNWPGRVPYSTNDNNNNIYMLRTTADATQTNVLTSTALSVTTGSTNYVSFYAFSTPTAKTTAEIITATADNEGTLSNIMVISEPVKIQTPEWQKYVFTIAEDEYSVSRSYYLRLIMQTTGHNDFTYLDNVNVSTDAITGDQVSNIDLTNPLMISDVWQAMDENTPCYVSKTNEGLNLANKDGKKTIIQDTLAYNLSANEYYKFVIKAHGNNAYLGFNGYDGLLEVITDAVDENWSYEYELYLHIQDDATKVNFQITLGQITNKENISSVVDGSIFIESIQVEKVDNAAYDEAKIAAKKSGARTIVLTPASATEESTTTTETKKADDHNFFGENWWYLVPTLITAFALLFALITFLFRRVKFDKHITKKNTSYARDMRLKNQRNKIVAQKAAKVDNVTDETKGN